MFSKKKRLRFMVVAVVAILSVCTVLISFQNCANMRERAQNRNTGQNLVGRLKDKTVAGSKNLYEKESYDLESPFGFHSAFYRPFVETNEVINFHDIWSEKNREGAYTNAIDIGVRWERVGVREPEKNEPYDWTISDAQYAFVPEGINILTNIWVRHTEFLKPGTWQFQNEQFEIAYTKYLKALVERYDGDGENDMPGLENPIHYWQIENEAIANNLKSGPFHINNPDDPELNLDWEGFSKLAKISYDAIKSVDPNAKVMIGGTVGGELLYLENPSIFFAQLNDFYLPLLKKLSGKSIDIFDIHYYGFATTTKKNNWFGSREVFRYYREILDENGYKNVPIWFTEAGSPSLPNSEVLQASDIIKRYIFPLSYGVKKIFWAWALLEGYPPLTGEDYFDHTGLIYDGIGKGDPGYGVKKLSYYSYKLMTQKLSGANWHTLKIVQEKDGIYVYKVRDKKNKYIWVIWNENNEERLVSISGIKSNQAITTEAVANYEFGRDVVDYATAFRQQTKKTNKGAISFYVKDKPIFVEEE